MVFDRFAGTREAPHSAKKMYDDLQQRGEDDRPADGSREERILLSYNFV